MTMREELYKQASETKLPEARSLIGGDMMFSGYIFDVEGTLVDSVPQNLLRGGLGQIWSCRRL